MFYKAFNQNLQCKDFQYEIGQTYKLPPKQKLILCSAGFHACFKLEECLHHYPFHSRFCKVELGPNRIDGNGVIVSDQIMIVEEIFCPLSNSNEGIALYNKDGKLHCDNGPAIDWKGNQIWYNNGQLHRENGPAVNRTIGTKIWYINGKCHREDGPAVEWSVGLTEWYINGKRQQTMNGILTGNVFQEKVSLEKIENYFTML